MRIPPTFEHKYFPKTYIRDKIPNKIRKEIQMRLPGVRRTSALNIKERYT